MPPTRFSVVITCYNHAGYIGDAVDSALGQSRAPSQVIVVDDASTDTSVEVLRRYGNAITLISHAQNQGISRARNAGTAPATGDYLVYLDGDDILKPWALAAYEQLVQTRHAAIILASLSWFEGSPPAEQDVPRSIDFVEYKRLADKDRSFRSSASAIVVERRKVLQVDGWTESIAFMQDHDLLAKLALSGPAIQILSPATVFYRSHALNNYKDTGRLLKDCHNLVAAWRSRPESRASARNLVGGPVFFVLQRACAARLYREAARVLARSWFVVAAAALARLRAVVFGRHPSQILAVSLKATHNAPAAVVSHYSTQ